ncbi:MAG: sugar phosphate nucleotidyltransferase [Candidatus Promineifilaceae bacterium]|nr:sugar phosphate nucleotidyltransferase [Candidatus Promineifilaceae bacterium]
MSDIPVVIFCGGEGTRMRGGTLTKKELVEIGDRPIIWHVMRIFSAYGFNRFVLPLGYEAQQIKRYFLNYEGLTRDFTVRVGRRRNHIAYHGEELHPEWEVTLVDTGRGTDKASRVYRVQDYLTADRFFLTYGDGVSDINIGRLLEFHLAHGRLATITAVQPAHYQYGVMQANDEGLVSHYEEYPSLPYWINGGFMLFEKEALTYMKDGANLALETGVLQELIAKRQVMMYRHDGYWRSMDTLKDAIDLEKEWHHRAPWKIWQDEE